MNFEKSKKDICLNSFSEQIYIIWVILTYISLSDECLLNFANLQYFPLASFATSYRVTDEVFIAET